MHTPDQPAEPRAALTVAELEARFEMEALPCCPAQHPGTDWSCNCTFQVLTVAA